MFWHDHILIEPASVKEPFYEVPGNRRRNGLTMLNYLVTIPELYYIDIIHIERQGDVVLVHPQFPIEYIEETNFIRIFYFFDIFYEECSSEDRHRPGGQDGYMVLVEQIGFLMQKSIYQSAYERDR